MGYQAPSPEEVYRYALRLDGERSLTDRFGISIVFVNDTSPVCREFLLKHCVDLCLRTADRIRFVFFSDLPHEAFEHIVEDMRNGRERGMLRSVLDLLQFGRRADFERDPWRLLRPRAFRPLRTVQEISERLSWECDLRTAMPGAGMAMQFAQRLGIGRYVPCILVFTEVGELHVDLLPIAGLSVDRIYHHVRTWVDEFYEQNRALINEWDAVEKEIATLTSKAHGSLYDVHGWRNARVRDWETLSTLSALIHAAEHGDRTQFEELAGALRYQTSLQPATTTLLRDLLRTIQNADASNRKAQELSQIASSLAAAQTSVDVLQALTSAHTRARAIGAELPRVLEYAKTIALRLEHPETPLGFVELWWRTVSRQKLSLKLFKRERSRWEHTLALGPSAYREEFEIIRKAIDETPLCGDPAEASLLILLRYREELPVAIDSELWRRETEHYRDVLQHFLHRAYSTAPAWLRDRRLALTIGETFPRSKELDSSSLDQMLDERPRLRAAIEGATATAGDAVRDDIAATTSMVNAYRDEVRSELEARARAHTFPAEWTGDFLADALAELRAARRRLELVALSSVKESAPRGVEWNEQLAAGLHRALDRYAAVSRLFRYPHRDDPLIRRVPIDMSLLDAAGVHKQEGTRQAQLKESLDTAATAAASFPQVRSDAVAVARDTSPAQRLGRALRGTVADDRLWALLKPFHGDTIEARVEAVVVQGHVAGFLRNLSSGEQEGISRALVETSSEAPNAEHPLDMILVALGLYTATTANITSDRAARELQEKVLADDFDVFIAHNSHDKPAILELGRRLRAAGIYPWIDVEQIAPGRWFQDVIQAVIPQVRAAAIFIGGSGLGRWQALELRTFITACVERGLPVIPVLLPGAADIPQEALFLRELNYVRFVGGLDDDQAFGRLVWGITGEKPVTAS